VKHWHNILNICSRSYKTFFFLKKKFSVFRWYACVLVTQRKNSQIVKWPSLLAKIKKISSTNLMRFVFQQNFCRWWFFYFKIFFWKIWILQNRQTSLYAVFLSAILGIRNWKLIILFSRTYPSICSHSWSFHRRIHYLRAYFLGPYLSHVTRSPCIGILRPREIFVELNTF